MFFKKNPTMISADEALPGRDETMPVPARHLALGTSLVAPFEEPYEIAYFALGCFWGAERKFFESPGVRTTAVGYMGGYTKNPTYQEVCSGATGHAEAVMVVFDPTATSYEQLLKVFFESHDPTQGNRQGNDVGTQYRSAIYTTGPAQREAAERAKQTYGEMLAAAGYGPITTEIEDAGAFYYAEDYHQQYLVANPNGYCGLGGTGVSCPVGLLSE